MVALDNAVALQIHEEQCGGSIDERIKGFGRLWLM
jgi:hypothetical protein